MSSDKKGTIYGTLGMRYSSIISLISFQEKEKNIKQIKNCYGFVLLNAAQFSF